MTRVSRRGRCISLWIAREVMDNVKGVHWAEQAKRDEAGLPRRSAKRPIRLAGSRAGTRRLTNCQRCRVPSRSAWRTVDLTPLRGRRAVVRRALRASLPVSPRPGSREFFLSPISGCNSLGVGRGRERGRGRDRRRRWSGCTPPPRQRLLVKTRPPADPTSSVQIIPYIMNTMLTKVVRSVTGPRSSVSRLNSARRNLRVQATISQVRLSACLLELSGIPLP